MEWIETTGRTIDEAKEVALDELGVDETDAEFEVVTEPKSGLFGRVRVEARVRARVRPTAPRPKEDRRDRRRRRSSEPSSSPTGEGDAASAASAPAADAASSRPAAAATVTDVEAPPRPESEASGESPSEAPARSGAARGEGRRNGRGRRSDSIDSNGNEETTVSSVTVPLDQQAEEARQFVEGLVQEFGVQGTVRATVDETEEVIDVAVTGEGLGLLIGPKGSTLLAIQDLTRAAVQQKTGAGNGRLNVDVAGYRQKRTEALVRFARQVASEVTESGTRRALEPMTAADRKIIHDALTDVEGVTTVSEGEDTARRVVIEPA